MTSADPMPEPAEQFAARMDALGVDALREQGSLKWTLFPHALGAFVAEMDFGVAPEIAKAAAGVVERGLLGYAPVWFTDDLRRATADYCADSYGWQVPVEQVAVLPDVITALVVAMQHFSRPGSPVIMLTPCYMPFLEVPGYHGRGILQVPMRRTGDGWGIDEPALHAAFDAGGDLVVLCNPHNPIGKVYRRDELERLCAVVQAHGGRVLSDEIHAPLRFGNSRHIPYASISPTAAAHSITAVSASKAWNLAGLKCAQLILTNDQDRELFADVGKEVQMTASNPGIAASTAAYRYGAPWLRNVMAYLEGNRQLVLEAVAAMPGAGMVAPEATYLAWIDVRAAELDEPARCFRRAGLAVTDGAKCGVAGQGHVRLTFATPRPVLEQMLDRMAAALSAG